MSNKPQNLLPEVSGWEKIQICGPGRSGACKPPAGGPDGQEMQKSS